MAEPIRAAIVLLTLSEAAAQLRKTEKQLRWMVYSGTAPKSALIGGRRMFRQADVDEFVNAAFEQQAS